ncbi:MAG: hypothetical protein QM653_05290 [Dysgonomonas sp.]|uniref:hypothetical protein n=1 Tax=Dysgonomonas sp. TaxID=1891233 RepID=UPI0039E3D7E1
MIVIIIVVVLLILSVFAIRYIISDLFIPIGMIMPFVLVLVCCVLYLISVPVGHYHSKGVIAEYHSVSISIRNARHQNVSEIESYAIQRDITKWNACIVRMKYLNSLPILDPLISDEINNLRILK